MAAQGGELRRHTIMRIAFAIAILATLAPAQNWKSDWMTDFAAAQARAKAEKKDLLVNFTGSDWHVMSIKLYAEVLSKPQFLAAVQKDFVLVAIDFPKVQVGMSKELLAQNDHLMGHYSVAQLPIVLLLDAAGHPYQWISYEKGGPRHYLEALEKRRRHGFGFKAALALAMRKNGTERARTIDDALVSLTEEMRSKNHDLMREIIKLDADGKAGLKRKYLATVQLKDASVYLEGMLAKHMEKGEGAQALAKLEAVIAQPKNPMHQQMALYLKGMIIMDTTRNVGDALAALDMATTLAPRSPLAAKIREARNNIKPPTGGGK